MPAPASTPVEFTVTADPTTADVPVRFPDTLPVMLPTKLVAVIIPLELTCLDDISTTDILGVPVSP